MKKYLYIFAAASMLLTGCYDDLSEETRSHVEALKNQDIASIQQQVKNITESLNTIESLSTELSGYTEILKKVSESLETDYSTLSQNLETVKTSLETEIGAAASEMLSEYEKVRKALEGKITEINSVITVLQEKKSDLDKRSDALRKSLDEDYATIEWMEATFATMESQQLVAGDVETIKIQVEEINNSLKAAEKEITNLLETKISDIENISEQSLKTAVEELTSSYKSAIKNASDEVSQAFEDALEPAISTSEESLKGWVSEKLDGYLTIARANGYINAFNTLVGTVPEGKSIQSQIDLLQASLNSAQEELTTAYKAAIESLFSGAAEDMQKAIADEIAKVVGDIETLAGKVTALEGEVINLKSKVTELQGYINTIDGQIAAINKSLKVLDEFDGSLQTYVESVKAYLENNDTEKFNETKAFIDALQESADAIQGSIDSLKTYVGTLPGGVTDDVVTWAEKTMGTVNEQFKLYKKASDIESYKSSIDNLIGEQSGSISADSTKLSKLVDDAKTTIDGWIDEDLKAYHTATKVGTRIDSLRTVLKGLISEGDSKLNSSLDSLKNAYEKASSDFITAYGTAISNAITQNQGKVDSIFNKALESANKGIQDLNTGIDTISTNIGNLKTDIATIKTDIGAITTGIGNIEGFIAESGHSSLQKFVDSVKTELGKCPEKFATVSQVDTLKKIIYGDGTDANPGLKSWVDQMKGLMSDLETANNETDKLDAFLRGFSKDSTLTVRLNHIKGILEDLKEEVDGDGTDTKPGLQAMIDGILTALYGGPDKTKDNATDSSIFGKIQALTDNTLALMFHSITYIPKNSDASVTHGNNVKLEFLVEPANLVSLLNTKNCTLTPSNSGKTATITSVSGVAATGVLTVMANVPEGCGWISLCVEIKDSSNNTLEFTSQYIRVK